MNWDRIELNWRRYKLRAKGKWEQLTDHDLETVAGCRDRLAARLAERYGTSHEEADSQIEEWRRDIYPPPA